VDIHRILNSKISVQIINIIQEESYIQTCEDSCNWRLSKIVIAGRAMFPEHYYLEVQAFEVLWLLCVLYDAQRYRTQFFCRHVHNPGVPTLTCMADVWRIAVMKWKRICISLYVAMLFIMEVYLPGYPLLPGCLLFFSSLYRVRPSATRILKLFVF
jgi:hypothetical protein